MLGKMRLESKLCICATLVALCIVGARSAGGYNRGYGGGVYGGNYGYGKGYSGGGYRSYGKGGGGHSGGGTVIVPYRYPVPVPVYSRGGSRQRLIPATIIRQGGNVGGGGGLGGFGGGGIIGLLIFIGVILPLLLQVIG